MKGTSRLEGKLRKAIRLAAESAAATRSLYEGLADRYGIEQGHDIFEDDRLASAIDYGEGMTLESIDRIAHDYDLEVQS